MGIESGSKETLRFDKLIDATDLEGEKNQEVFEITRRIEKELSDLPEFIGVAPFGSRLQGYATDKESSDYDIYIFEDKSLRDGGERIIEKLHEILLEYLKKGIKIQIVEQYFNEENVHGLVSMVDTVPPDYYYLTCFANLCRSGRGEKIELWRNKIKEEVLKLPKEKQEKLYRMFSQWLLKTDRISVPKIKKRVSGFDEEEYMNARSRLWLKRVLKIYGE